MKETISIVLVLALCQDQMNSVAKERVKERKV